jgi:hypothetical protein
MTQGELVALLVERGCDARKIRMTSAGCSSSKADEPCREPERPKWRVLNSIFSRPPGYGYRSPADPR